MSAEIRRTDQPVVLTNQELAFLQACVGFHARAQMGPAIRARLSALWHRRERARDDTRPGGRDTRGS